MCEKILRKEILKVADLQGKHVKALLGFIHTCKIL